MTLQGALREFAVPSPGSGPGAITSGPDGNLWFTEQASQQIGRITPSGEITEFLVSTYYVDAYQFTFGGIAVGVDGALWFTDVAGDQVGRITTRGAISLFPLPATHSAPAGMTTGPGKTVWFTEKYGNQIGRIMLSTQ
jgi:virginiamycin B lyase